MRFLEGDKVAERMRAAVEAAFPHLSLEVLRRERGAANSVWKAVLRVKDGGVLASVGTRRHRVLAIGAALEALPEQFRMPPDARGRLALITG